jgi:hypothetical protein
MECAISSLRCEAIGASDGREANVQVSEMPRRMPMLNSILEFASDWASVLSISSLIGGEDPIMVKAQKCRNLCQTRSKTQPGRTPGEDLRQRLAPIVGAFVQRTNDSAH